MSEAFKIEEIFGENLFTLNKMKARLPKSVYNELSDVIKHGGELSMAAADVIAKAMMDWAVEHGATHFTHWFQPMVISRTAEKRDSFVKNPDSEGYMMTAFSGKQLIKGEPDASSFPSGGLRETWEARGYTIWDVSSPVFLKEDETGVTLCIPTVFCSYTGETLDKKTPLLRSMEAVNKQALRVCHLFGDDESTRVTSQVGPEQEYFLVDREKFLARKDLIYTGRTLFGANAPKGQELNDQYFGAIKERVGSFMKELNEELWKCGVTVATEHNEVAPGQFEIAPIFSVANVAVDHNLIVMETLEKVAKRHGLACLLHEKPFAGVNGSGKHNNWSIGTDTGANLLEPGKKPHTNKQFLFVLACIMKAVDTHADLLRQSAADVGNDHRLGANEAPPAIISMFLGEQLEDIVQSIIENGVAETSRKGGTIDFGVNYIPAIKKDATDRNRTSPFAFTGNKFEFRMVGSMDSIAGPNTVINAMVAEAFKEACDELEAAEDFDSACDALIQKYMTEHQRIIFNGNGYSEEWVKEAEKRGLPNITSMVAATETLVTDKATNLFEKFDIYSKEELASRAEIAYETYALSINIEALTMIDMASKEIIPAVIDYTANLASAVAAVESVGASAKVQKELLGKVTGLLEETSDALEALKEVQQKSVTIECVKERAEYSRDVVTKAMAELRTPADELEKIVDDEMWPFPTYGDLLFEL